MWGCDFCGAFGTPTTHHCERYDAWLEEREQWVWPGRPESVEVAP